MTKDKSARHHFILTGQLLLPFTGQSAHPVARSCAEHDVSRSTIERNLNHMMFQIAQKVGCELPYIKTAAVFAAFVNYCRHDYQGPLLLTK